MHTIYISVLFSITVFGIFEFKKQSIGVIIVDPVSYDQFKSFVMVVSLANARDTK